MTLTNLPNPTARASTPPSKDLDQKQILSALMAHITPTLVEREQCKETMAAQTSGEASNTVLGTPDSAISSPGPTAETPEPSFVVFVVLID